MTTETIGRALNRASFFAAVRSSLFGGRLTESQVQGLDALLTAAPGDMPLEHLAYCLATAFHETGAKMQPVVENLNYTSAARIRAVWPSRFPPEASAKPFINNPRGLANKVYGGRMGNVGENDGWLFRGRGFVQITGVKNYFRASRMLTVDFLAKPDLATDLKLAAAILYCGMQHGWFTGKKLSDFFKPGLSDPYNARRIVNGLDRAADIAEYHRKFLAALKAAEIKVPIPDPIPPPPDIDPAPVPVSKPAQPAGFFTALATLLKRIFA